MSLINKIFAITFLLLISSTVIHAEPSDTLWVNNIGWIENTPVVGTDGTIYVYKRGGDFYGLNEDGTVKFTIAGLGAYYPATIPAIATDGTIYVVGNQCLHSINADGAENWQSDPVLISTSSPGDTISPALSTDESVIYVPSAGGHPEYDGKLLAFSTSGDLLWTLEGLDRGYSGVAPVVAGDLIFLLANSGKLYSIHKDGTINWVFDPGEYLDIFQALPSIGADGTIYFGSPDGSVFAVTHYGELKWRYSTPSDARGIWSTPAIGPDGTIYVQHNACKLYALTSEGSLLWEHETCSTTHATYYNSSRTSPAIGDNGVIYVGSDDFYGTGGIYAVNPDGTRRWEREDLSRTDQSLAMDNSGVLYAGSYTTGVIALATSASGLSQSAWPVQRNNARGTGTGLSRIQNPPKPISANIEITESISIEEYQDYSYLSTSDETVTVRVTPSNGTDSLIVDVNTGANPNWAGGGEYTASQLSPDGYYELLVDTKTGVTYTITVFGKEVQNISELYTLEIIDPQTTPTWNWLHPTLPVVDLVAVESNGSGYVAVGENGTILLSDDREDWVIAQSNTNSPLSDILWDGQQYIAVGSFGTVLASPDGITWEKRTFPTSDALFGISFNGNSYVAITLFGKTFFSPDGFNWVENETQISGLCVSITWGNGQFIIAGRFSSGGTIMTSLDGQSWSVQNTPVSDRLMGITWGGSVFVATGENGTILTSSDGEEWYQQTSGVTGSIVSVIHDGQQFVANCAPSTILSSSDGATWTVTPIENAPVYNNQPVYFRGITNTADGYVLVGEDGHIMYSNNLVSWDIVSPEYPLNDLISTYNPAFLDSAWNGKIYVFVSRRGVIWSSDDTGSNWTVAKLEDGLIQPTFIGVTTRGSHFYAVGGDSNGIIAHSVDGKDWNLVTTGLTSVLFDIKWFYDKFFAVGENGAIVVSTNGVAWQNVYSGVTTNLKKIAWNGINYVIVGDLGTILVSTDGEQWQKVDSIDPALYLTSIAWNGSLFVAVGTSGAILTSIDGLIWNAAESGTTEYIADITWTGEKFIAIEYLNFAMLTSIDGITWQRTEVGPGKNWTSILWDGRNLTMTSTISSDQTLYGAIVKSEDFSNDPDRDTDNDGIPDIIEDTNMNGIVEFWETDPENVDSDGDGIQDGTELGYNFDTVSLDTDLSTFIPDLDPTSISNPVLSDSDGDGVLDGDEDLNKNGRWDLGETSASTRMGDFNSDGITNLEDLICILRTLSGGPVAESLDLTADIDGDQKISNIDGIILLNMLKELP